MRSVLRRYHLGARYYDRLSGERWVYRPGRVRAIAALGLRRGDSVLDVGCGTGLNFALLVDRLGPGGTIHAVDRSPDMLARARQRVEAHGWGNVELTRGDAGRDGTVDAEPPVDAVIFTYSLSIIDDWRSAYDAALRRLRPGGRIAVVDMALPVGRWRVLWPLARLACLTGGADPYRAPWRRVLDTTTDTSHTVLKGGHVHVAVGTRTVGG